MKSRYEQLAEGDTPKAMPIAEWNALTLEQRVIHSNRNLPSECPHKADLSDWPEDLRESYSFDPYTHTAHMDPCFRSVKEIGDKCQCQTCIGKFGIWRGGKD